MRPHSTDIRDLYSMEGKSAEGGFKFRVEAHLLDFISACHLPANLDDLFELALVRLLDIEHVRHAEISLFNKKNDLVLIAEGSKPMREGGENRQIISQSWILDSVVRYSTRRTKLPPLFPATLVALMTSERPLGFLSIRLDRIRTTDWELLANFNLLGRFLSARIKEITLRGEMEQLTEELRNARTDNRTNQQRITSLSKELYALCAISTKINRSLDIGKSLRISIAKVKEVFKASAVLVYVNSPDRSKPRLYTEHAKGGNRKFSPDLLERIESVVMRDFFSARSSKRDGFGSPPFYPGNKTLDHYIYKSMVTAPLSAKRKLVGAVVLLYESSESFNQDNLRLLCGIGDLIGMAAENMDLYRQSQQKKKTAAFLVQSISKFNEKLDLEKTLKSIAEKSAEFIGRHWRIYLFTETRFPMIRLNKCKKEGGALSKSETCSKIEPSELRDFYEQARRRRRSSVVFDLARDGRLKKNAKSFFEKEGIKSIVSVPLTLAGKSMGLLLFCGAGGKRTFDHMDLSVAEALGAAASVAIENSRAYAASMEMSGFLEKRILEKTMQIQKIQERMEDRVENRNDIVFRVNADNRFVFVNKAMETLTGLTREDICRNDFRIEQFVAPEDRERVASCFKIVSNGKLPIIKDLEYRHLGGKGTDRLISLTIYPDTDASGVIEGIEGVGRDITENKRLEAELAKAKDLALLGEFSSAIAHQVRNPLGNILMGTKLLQRSLGLEMSDLAAKRREKPNASLSRSGGDNNGLAEIFEHLSEGIENLNRVVAKLVEYTKTLKLNLSDQDIRIVLEENLSVFDGQIAQSGIQVEKHFERDLPRISVDAVLVGQALQNVIHNAIQAMPQGGRLVVSASVHSEVKGYAVISVGDTGPGIAAGEIEKIFHPFYTTKDSGTGLGLSLAHRIVEAHRGRIRVCNNPCPHFPASGQDETKEYVPQDKGSTFHIVLPTNVRSKRNYLGRIVK